MDDPLWNFLPQPMHFGHKGLIALLGQRANNTRLAYGWESFGQKALGK
jgi:hypothetical protein